MADQTKTNNKVKAYRGELGGSGTSVYNGVVSDVEYLPQFDTEYGGEGLRTIDQMRKSDPIIKSSLRVIKLGILQGEWTVEGVDGQDDVKEFVEDALFKRMDKTFEQTLWDILTYLDFGFFVSEKVYKFEDNKIWLSKLAYRDPKSITKFETQDKKDGVTQQLQGDGDKGSETISIPMQRLAIFTNEKEGDNWRGISILRSAYKPWFFKENFEKIDAIGFEREAVGIPVFTMPQNPDPKDSETADELGQNIRTNEKSYLKLPFGWKFEVMYPTGGQRRNADESIRRFNRDIVANVLAHFLDLGAGATGSRALSNDQSDAFYRSLQATGDYICSIINEFVIKQMVDFNFNNITEYPKLRVTGIEKLDVEVFSRALSSLILANVITPDPDLEDFVRSQFRLPPLSEEIKNLKSKMQLQGMAQDSTLDDSGKPNSQNKVDDKNKSKVDNSKDKNDVDRGQSKDTNFKPKSKKASEIVVDEAPKYWRPFTFAEEKVNFDSLLKQINRMETDIKSELPKILAPEIQQLVDGAELALSLQDAKRLEDLTIKFKDKVRDFVILKMRLSFDIGKVSASNELDVLAPRTADDMINMIVTKANTIADQLTSNLLNGIKINSLDLINRQVDVDEAKGSLSALITDQLVRSTGLTASVVTMGGINDGRQTVFDLNPEKIYAMQRSEVLDAATCNYCLSIDGRVVAMGDPITKHGPFHFMCRGIWVEILSDEVEKPEISGVPQQLRDSVGTLSEFEQLSKPIPLENSLAAEFLKK